MTDHVCYVYGMVYIRVKVQRVGSHATSGNGVMELELYCHLSLDIIVYECVVLYSNINAKRALNRMAISNSFSYIVCMQRAY